MTYYLKPKKKKSLFACHFSQHSGSELVYTNTLKSVTPYTMIRRSPVLILPLACRIPGVQVKGPTFAVGIPTDRETFGILNVWIEFHLPGQGPLAKFTSTPRFRSNFQGRKRRTVQVGTGSSVDNPVKAMVVGSRIKQLDLYLLSNCSIGRAQMVVSDCMQSETEDFAVSQPLLQHGSVMHSISFYFEGGQMLEEII